MSNVNFVDIGFSNYVEVGKILTVNRPDSSPIKRMIQQAKDSNRFLDLTQGKKTRSIITQKSENGIIITASAVQTATIIERVKRSQQTKEVIERVPAEDILETTVQE
ncbi:DUF370 domain-containing protein [Priestia megaterium]|uniref:DUF370 domain-containing protein n=1 Tax=Priestia megaterium TaxID=1404 RepID=UPI000D50FE7F|nr:DUF370 domain-containing protein [Priestia megaterium]PVC75138.1 DUF370 domain-containing protein [Priestia megaterium]